VRVAVLVAAVAWVVAMYLLQVYGLGGRLVIVPFLLLGPLAASMVLDWPDTALTALAAAAAVTLLSHRTGDLGTGQGELRVLGSAVSGLLVVVNSAVRVRRERKLRSMTEVAAVAQGTILRPVPPQVAGLSFASRYQSASADSLVGGDLFDVLDCGAHARVLIGDVRGKGLAAVQLAAAVLSAFRVQGAAERSLPDLAEQLEKAAVPGMTGEDFVTVLLCDVWPGGRLDVVSCGHPAPLVLAPGARPVGAHVHESPPVGLGVAPALSTAQLPPGWQLLLHTDGLTEARDRKGRFFSDDQIADAVQAAGGAPEAALDRLVERVRRHVGGALGDDLAVVLVSCA
jgi:serine phosphatase RsbU (regulator of sigma subunit)